MSQRLIEMVNNQLLKLGDNSIAKLSVATGLSPAMIHAVRNGKMPLPKNVLKLALACGISEEEALKLAHECSSLAKAG